MGMETSELGITTGCNKLPLTTTFIQTDTNAFREVVQRLTGTSSPPSDPAQQAQLKRTSAGTITSTSIPNNITNSTVRKTKTWSSTQTCKLHERRQYMKMRPKLEIVKPPTMTFHSKPPSSSSSSPSVPSPCTIFSKLSILQLEQAEENKSTNTQEEEERAIQERRFYLHPSPCGCRPPELLTLFPLTSPKSCQKE
ncbi:VQ motif-containing protein 31 [Prunus persica]|nr:VQ motif-containing protein 31 [Prunus persica]